MSKKCVYSPKKFYERYREFAGSVQHRLTFLDNIPFRKWLDKQLDVGTTLNNHGEAAYTIHWSFRTARGEVIDSYRNKSQPAFDMHCTMYSLYNQLYHTQYQKAWQLKPLILKVKYQVDYVNNLIKLYEALIKFTSDNTVVALLHSYPSWQENNQWVTDGKYADMARANIAMLECYKKDLVKNQPLDELFTVVTKPTPDRQRRTAMQDLSNRIQVDEARNQRARKRQRN